MGQCGVPFQEFDENRNPFWQRPRPPSWTHVSALGGSCAEFAARASAFFVSCGRGGRLGGGVVLGFKKKSGENNFRHTIEHCPLKVLVDLFFLWGGGGALRNVHACR